MSSQIIPSYNFPGYIETVINDNTVDTETTTVEDTSTAITTAYAVRSEFGIDGVFVPVTSKTDGINKFGKSDFSKYGQPLMQALKNADQDNAVVYMCRVMPENASYANVQLSAYVKVDDVDTYSGSPSKRKFRIKFTSKSFSNVVDDDGIKSLGTSLDGNANSQGYYIDAEGFTQYPVVYATTIGRGKYGNKSYGLRITSNQSNEKESDIKIFNFDIMKTKNGISRLGNYVGSPVISSKFDNSTFINDLLDDYLKYELPGMVQVVEENYLKIYELYIEFCKEQNELLKEEYETKLEEYAIPEGMLEGTVTVTEEYADKVSELQNILALIAATEESALPDDDEFDLFFGMQVNSDESHPMIYFMESLTGVDTNADDYDSNQYTSSEIADFTASSGLLMLGGSDGYFDTPRSGYTIEDEYTEAYNNAYNGTFDRRILSPRRIRLNGMFDAGYPYDTKCTMVALTLLRNENRLYLDVGYDYDSLSGSKLKALLEAFPSTEGSLFDNNLISKNIHTYIPEVDITIEKRRVRVTEQYWFSQNFINHMNTAEYGISIPVTGSLCELGDHVRDSLLPEIDDSDKDLKETLNSNRFNYYEPFKDNVFRRSTQNTSQSETSDLTEENNVLMLYSAKRIIEDMIRDRNYNFAEKSARADFTDLVTEKFSSWIGSKVNSLTIEFKASAYEQKKSIVHAYLAIVFRPLEKVALIEIDVNQREYEDYDE